MSLNLLGFRAKLTTLKVKVNFESSIRSNECGRHACFDIDNKVRNFDSDYKDLKINQVNAKKEGYIEFRHNLRDIHLIGLHA